MNLKIKIFADGANLEQISMLNKKDFIKGFTTNPTLMRQAGINNYEGFAKKALEIIGDKPISFEVFSDDFDTMINQALKIHSWSDNVYVKIPITNTKGELTSYVISELINRQVKINVTAVMTKNQIRELSRILDPKISSCVSIFAGRIADTGVEPNETIEYAINQFINLPNNEIIWASPRELLNIIQANKLGCHIITATNEILKKMELIGYSLEEYSLDTVKMFYKDANEAGYVL
jgi:transaldolase